MHAEEAYVLSPADVSNIRKYVQHKYGALPQEKKTEMIADAVNRIIHKQLPSFDESIKRQVTAQLIRTAVLEQKRPVRADDIFAACLLLDERDQEIEQPMHAWVEKQLQSVVEIERYRLAMDKLRSSAERMETSADSLPNASLSVNESWLLLKNELQPAGDGQLAKEPFAAGAAGSSGLADVIPLPLPLAVPQNAPVPRKRRNHAIVYGLLSLLLVSVSLLYGESLTRTLRGAQPEPILLAPIEPVKIIELDGLPQELRYVEIDKKRLTQYLKGKSSILARQPYLDAIIAQAKSFDIHPLLLFAITGQEQAFVPTTNKQAKEIANNPFNVFHSWKEYNTTISDSAEIASRTIVNLSKGRPEGMDPFTWINRKYAEDPNWSNGVRSIFASMKQYVETTSKK
ncbi:hypothetical protein BBD42_23875 [Paenibacillus sp. BIHB 4019]|uniref:Uncharacterized protein n=1 Tax=Paenibacillus sp. BIHB 4019 TaxID=1870819 RepID=A0A1B2DN97_9BACL|nr:glucosaminidase domain-containing protein [Paenibacillus sp. BIHB 4019]ANY69182.1 hypothetical protein BBD42_23875 [Paenibacillus sp. BIHB 4019]